MGLPGLRRLDHVGVTVPDLEEATRFLVDVLSAASTSTRWARSSDDGDWMSEHLGVHPRATVPENRFFRCGGQTVFEVFQYTAPDQRTAVPKNSDIGGHHLALYVDDLDARWTTSGARASRPWVSLNAISNLISKINQSFFQRWVYFRAPWGLQMESRNVARTAKAFDRQQQTTTGSSGRKGGCRD